MVNPKKQAIREKLQEKLAKAKSFVLVDHTGLSVPQQEELRKRVRQTGGEFTVTKNTLMKLALKEEVRYQKLEASLKGPTATLFAYEDELAAIKALVNFSEEFEIPQLKMGVFEGKILAKEALLELAKIPGREALYTQLAYLLQSPISRLAGALSSDTRKLAFILANMKKEGGEN